jgi:hypothetical protein
MSFADEDHENRSKSGFLARVREAAERRSYFVATLLNPSFHWFFTQGQDALLGELYIPGVSSLVNGIEASIRVTLAQLDPGYSGTLELSPYQLLSNTLLRKAREVGMPIEALAFPGESDFEENLPTKTNTKVVQLRHDICHGNILPFIQTMEYEQIQILTPECLRATAAQLLGISYVWARDLAQFRDSRGRRPAGHDLPSIPENPLAQWLV